MSTDLIASDPTDQFSMDSAAYEYALNSMVGWENDLANQQVDGFDGRIIDPSLNAFDPLTQPSPSHLDILHSLPSSASQTLTQSTVLFQEDFGNASAVNPSSTSNLSPPTHLFSPSKCQCLESLAVLAPRVSNAMQEEQLDGVYKVTEEVIKGCQDILDCTGCQISCTDLICMVAVFQKTDTCFEYIGKADLDSAIKLSLGGHELPINDPKLRAMLVMNLIQQATMVLDAISIRGQTMLRTLCIPSPQAQANIAYLETVITEIKDVLQKVAGSADKTGFPSMGLRGRPSK
ncbi:hypothetical protein G7Z17_g2760 [Cylindrodendrum hubeiense]|uniref:Uncharacterized protein n=1 Tax=Cylindrodendrum hubeiense TaxID=595255 RepID=A0A9P5LKN1_9HYPO|nr:hypothetical protein G7Z17_g2760 [Cylindrodendrum hubeiense]